MNSPDSRAAAAEALTSLLYAIHMASSDGVLLRSNTMPGIGVVDFSAHPDGLYGTFRKAQDSAFLALWATGSFPAGTTLQAHSDASDRQIANLAANWDTLGGRPWYFAAPWLIPANATVTVHVSKPGSLTFHGVNVYRKAALHNEDRDQEAMPAAVEMAASFEKLVALLKATDDLITPNKG